MKHQFDLLRMEFRKVIFEELAQFQEHSLLLSERIDVCEIDSILEPETELLSKLAGTENPAVLKTRILVQLSHWVEEYSVRFFENPWPAQEQGIPNPSYQKWAGKLWSVWKYHWEDAQKLKKNQDADIDLFQVAGSLEQGTGYQGQGELGGNPLEDILLVDAIIEGEAVAHEYFQKTYSALAELLPCGQDLWQDFYLTHLLEKKTSNGLPAIAGYQGHAGLKRWVVVAFRRFVSRQASRDQQDQGIKVPESKQLKMLLERCTDNQIETYERHYQIKDAECKQPLPRIRERISWLLQIVSDEQKLKHQNALQNLKQIQPYEEYQLIQQSHQTTPEIDSRWTGCIELLGALVLKLINSFSTVDSLILKLRFLEECKLADMELITGIHRGHLSRKIRDLGNELWSKLGEVIPENSASREECESCLELLNLPAFFKELAEWLRSAHESEQDLEEAP